MIFRHFRHLFDFSPRQGRRNALAFGSKIKNLLEIALNLIVKKPIIQVKIAKEWIRKGSNRDRQVSFEYNGLRFQSAICLYSGS